MSASSASVFPSPPHSPKHLLDECSSSLGCHTRFSPKRQHVRPSNLPPLDLSAVMYSGGLISPQRLTDDYLRTRTPTPPPESSEKVASLDYNPLLTLPACSSIHFAEPAKLGEELREKALARAMETLRSPDFSMDFRAFEFMSQRIFTVDNGFSVSIGKQLKFQPFIRWTDVVPYNHNLYGKWIEEENDYTNFLNASRIQLCGKSFIATDAPTLPSIANFWNMVWTENIEVMVNLTERFEKGRKKADLYWIESSEENQTKTFTDTHGQKQVHLTLVEEKFILDTEEGEIDIGGFNKDIYDQERIQYIVRRTYKLEKEGETKTVTHFHYRHWPDHGAPTKEKELACYKKLLHRVAECSKERAEPILVHCSAGIGRTGTFIANLVSKGKTFVNPELAAAELVLQMRAQREGMVQTAIQFEFVQAFMR